MMETDVSQGGGWRHFFRRQPGRVCVAVALALAAGFRLAGAWWYALSPNPDYAVVVQMARHMARGEAFPVFFYGQAYMGSLEPAVSAALIRLVGPSPFVVCLGTATVSMLGVLAVFRIARRTAGLWAGWAAILLCLVGPFGYFHYACSPRGGYALGLLLTVLLLHGAAFLDAPSPGRHRRTIPAFFALGGLAGLAFWNFWLVLPAVGTAGLMLLFRLRGRLFCWPVWLPGLAGFVAGSLPWWVWNARNQWASLAGSGSVVDVRAYREAVRAMFLERIPSLIGFSVIESRPVQIFVYVCVAFLVALPLGVVVSGWRLPGEKPLRRLTGAVALYLLLFTLAFATSSFAGIRSPRYMLPLVPVFAVWAGGGLGALGRRMRSGLASGQPRLAWTAVVSAWVAVGVLTGLSGATLPKHREHPRAWVGAARALMDHPGAREALYADFILFGINWATDEAVCAVSPRLWRYRPYAERLEQAESPGVLENLGAFGDFLRRTSTTAAFDHLPGYRLHHQARAPAHHFGILPAEAVASIRDASDRDWRRELVDANGQTAAFLREAVRGDGTVLEVVFREPVSLAGVRLVSREHGPVSAWAVEGRVEPDGDWTTLSPMLQDKGFFWSGPRFYAEGMHHRSEIMFPHETRVHALRLRLPVHWSKRGVTIETLQFLTRGTRRAEQDPAALAAHLAEAPRITRVFADRWLANFLHARLPGRWVQREPLLTGEDPQWATSIPLDGSAAVVVNDCEADSVSRVLHEAGVTADRTSVGGHTVWVPVFSEATRPAPDLRFYAGQVFNNTLSDDGTGEPGGSDGVSAYFDGRLILLGVSEWEAVASPERALHVALDWRIAPDFVWPDPLFVFLHGIDSTRTIRFQIDEPLQLDPCAFATDRVRLTTTLHRVPVPNDLPSAAYRVLLGLLKPGLIPRRVVPETARPVDGNRVWLDEWTP